MDLFRTVIDGPYALLLVMQILVVAGLLLTLVWLFLYRSREMEGSEISKFLEESHDDHPEEAAAQSRIPAVTIAPAPETPIILPMAGDGLMDLTGAVMGNIPPSLNTSLGATRAHSESAPAMGLHANEAQDSKPAGNPQGNAPGDGMFEMQSAPTAPRSETQPSQSTTDSSTFTSAEQTAADTELLQSVRAESEQLKSKLEFLESKLLEYEIVQEEIANLSALRMENEQLRQDLVQMQRGQKPGNGGNSGSPSGSSSGADSSKSSESAAASVSGQVDANQQRALTSITAMARDTTIMMPEALSNESLSNEPGLGTNEALATEYPPEPRPNNVLQLPVGDKEPSSLGKVKEVAQAFQDPAVNTQLEKILTKLEQLTTK